MEKNTTSWREDVQELYYHYQCRTHLSVASENDFNSEWYMKIFSRLVTMSTWRTNASPIAFVPGHGYTFL